MSSSSVDVIFRLIPVTLKEAALDSPSFRTEAWHINEQIDAIERWIDLYVRAGHRLSTEAQSMQESVNILLGRSFPPFITENIIDHDYTLTAMKSYSEGLRIFWADFITILKGMDKNVIEQLENLGKKEIRQYKDVKRSFDAAQSRYDTLVARYCSQGRSKEESALREDAFQLYEARKLYVKVSFDLCLATVSVKHGLDRTIITAFSDQWLLMGQYDRADSGSTKIGDDLRKIRRWSDNMEASMKVLFKELNITRRDLEVLVMNEIAPPRDLAEYAEWTIPVPQNIKRDGVRVPPIKKLSAHHASFIDPTGVDSEKHGWLFVRTYIGKPARQVWLRRWVFVKDGIFGWLVQSPSKNYVEESDKVGVLLCNVKPAAAEERRFCIEVTTKDTSLVLQAESQDDLVSWLSVFDAAKKKALDSMSNAETEMAFEIIPPLPEFASTVQTSADTDLTHDRHDALPTINRSSLDLSRSGTKKQASNIPALQALINAGLNASQSITGHAQNFITGADKLFDEIVPAVTDLAPTTIANNPISTSMTKTATIAHAYVPSMSFPNGLTANTWGSVNWGSRQVFDNTRQRISASSEDGEESSKETGKDAANPLVVVDPPEEEIKEYPISAANAESFRNRTYPDFIPYELRIQDAQLRTIFSDIAPDEFVVLVTRATWDSQTGQFFSGRVYCTPTKLYMYANNADMIVARSRSIGEIASVRGESSQLSDSFYIDFKDGTEISAKVYLDSGPLIQTRLQFLIDNFGTGLDLQTIVTKLRESVPATEGWDDVPTPMAEDENADPMDKALGPRIGAAIALDRSLLAPNKQLRARGVKSKLKLPEQPVQYDLSNSGAQLVSRRKYEVSAKALYHIMFGDKSDLFPQLYESSKGIDVQQGAWIHLAGSNMDREIKFTTERTVIKGFPYMQQITVSQKVDKVEEYLLYVVSERRTPWNLPLADLFSQVSYYVISYASKASCVLSVWADVEYVSPSAFVKALIHQLSIQDIAQDSSVLGILISRATRQLGAQGRTSKSIQLYGQVGKSTAPLDPRTGFPITILQDKGQIFLLISRRSMFYLLLTKALRLVYKIFTLVLGLVFLVVTKLFSVVNGQWIILIVAGISLVLNAFLSSRSSLAYWTERRAYRTMSQVGVKPNGILGKAVFLKDLEEYISSGVDIASNPSGLCYGKFRSISELTMSDPSTENLGSRYTSGLTQQEALRISSARQRAAVERHQHLIAIRVIGRMEEELVRAEWGNWLTSERTRCLKLRSSGNATEYESYCNDCEDEYRADRDLLH
ncbi:uncharacterized protein V1516DRAFT_48972 [Lipomyces oligophaga]|uniref:uncharacterized protein n=1 Tax=Lipomyces oligophaga TaxID=45792 RepID=UPI0034CDB60F